MSKLVLWGHSLEDYQEMFDLTAADLAGNILEYGSGPSAVNAQLLALGKHCVSCDPLFALDKDTLKVKTTLVFADMIERLVPDQDKYNFSDYGGLDGLLDRRRAGMTQFFADYLAGKKNKRYLAAQMISLPFPDFAFDLALSSHYLFAGLDDQDEQFHIDVITELARVAREVRIFPMINRYGQPSPFLGPVLLALQQNNYGVEVRSVPYHLQKQGNAMLRVWAQQCSVAAG